MTIPFSKRAAVPPDVLVQQLQLEAVLLNINTGRYYGLDEVGTRMWTLLTTSDSIESAYSSLSREFEVDPDQLQNDLQNFVARLTEEGLLEVCDV